MADNLTTAQRLAFSGGSYDLANFPRKVELDDGLGTVTDITSRIESFGTTTVGLYNRNPADPGEWRFPTLTLTAPNDASYFTPGVVGSVWGAQLPTAFEIRFRVVDLVTDPTGSTNLVDNRFSVVEHSIEEGRATIIAIHRLARLWAARFELDDRDEMDWNGFNSSIFLGTP